MIKCLFVQILSQAESRAHRLGRAGAVCARYLLASGTADDVMWPLLQDKLHVLNNVGLSKDSFEDTTVKHQESKTNITQYLSPCRPNKNNYIPGTNIRKDAQNEHNESQINGQTDSIDNFLDDDEGDELLANFDL
ncbi:unnamed protein product [Colias eurytheme]|nr:unnamed protein product [Colias eurytheme]